MEEIRTRTIESPTGTGAAGPALPGTPESCSSSQRTRRDWPSISIKGDLTGEEDLLIEGRVDGKIELRKHSITVGKSGRIKADIYGKIITVEGTVEGNLYGEEQLIVRQSGTVHGNIVSPRVALEDGSNFKGSIDMSPKDRSAAPAQEKPVFSMKAP